MLCPYKNFSQAIKQYTSQSMLSLSSSLRVLLFGKFFDSMLLFMVLSCIPIMVIVFQVKSLMDQDSNL